MSTNDVLGGPLAQAVGLALLHALWQGAIVAGVLAAALALLSRHSAQVRYAVSCAALAVVFGLAIVTAVRSYTPRVERQAEPLMVSAAVPADAVLIPASDPSPSWIDRANQAIATVREHTPQIVIAWLFGVFILTIRLAVSWSRARTLAAHASQPAGDHWQRVVHRLADAIGLRRAVRLVVSRAVDVPSVIGWTAPAILLPVTSFTGLSPEQLEMVLAHELAHIRRHDFLINALQAVVETLLFYNPGVWYVSRQIRNERENCCDDLTVSLCGDAIEYARALAQLEELRAPSLALAANGGSLMARVRRLVGARGDGSLFSTNGWTAVAVMASFVMLLAVTTAPLMAARRAPKAPGAKAGTRIDVQAPPAAPKAAPKAKTTPAPDADADPVPDIDVDVDIEPPEIPIPIPTPAPVIAEAVADSGEEEQSSPTPPGKLSVDELIALRVQDITPEYIEQMRSIGFGELSLHDIIAFKMQGVTPDYVASLRAAGVPLKNARDVISLKVQNVTPEFVRQLAAAGYEHLTVRDLVRLAAVGVNAGFIRDMAKYKRK